MEMAMDELISKGDLTLWFYERDSTLAGIVSVDGKVHLKFSHASCYRKEEEDSPLGVRYVDLHEALIAVTDGIVEATTALPVDIEGFEVAVPGIETRACFLPTPYVVTAPCRIELMTSDGGRVVVRGSGCRVESVRTIERYPLFPYFQLAVPSRISLRR
jgi:hypothetical protein